MKIKSETASLFMDTCINECSNLPYFENFKSYKKSLGYDPYSLDLFDYILFIDRNITSYYKKRCLWSFQEFLDLVYPPQ